MLELRKLASVLSGVTIREDAEGRARFMRLSDLSDLKSGRTPVLARGELPEVARALNIDRDRVYSVAHKNGIYWQPRRAEYLRLREVSSII